MNKLIMGAVAYFALNTVLNQVFKKTQTGKQVQDAEGNTITVPANTDNIPPYLLRPKQLDEGAEYAYIPRNIAPIWPMDSYVDIVITLSDSFVATPIKQTPHEYLALSEKEFKLGNYSDKRSIDTTFKVPKAVQNNGTLWGHFYIGLSGQQLDPQEADFDPGSAYHFVHPLTTYFPKKKVFKTRNLLEGTQGSDPEVEKEEEAAGKGVLVANYYHPNTSLSFVPDLGVMEFPQQPPAVRNFIRLESTGARDGTGKNSWYCERRLQSTSWPSHANRSLDPVLFVNTFWQLRSKMDLVNETVSELPLHLDLNHVASWQFRALASVELSSRESARQAAFGQAIPGGGDGSEIELVKEIFFDTNPILLGITVVVSIAHLILETMAFGSDIAHYRKKKDNVGISVRSILANVFMQTVILLYLIDNSQNTSWMILGSQGIGIVIELWKITTIVNVRVRPAPPGSWFPYRIAFEDKHKLSETEEKTKEYDEIAFKYMYIAGVPLLIAYAIYSVIYDSHKSWYSYIITTLVGSVYAYGFLLMVPSLYINYRLKSVAHMPSKAMMYKFLNTFIDDLFAFTIKMPLLHRLATFRDDIIFFIYLYQKWAYKVDYTRINEFGQGGDESEPAKTDDKPLPAAAEAKPETVGSSEPKASGADAGKAKKRK
jgi:hypothetical protein